MEIGNTACLTDPCCYNSAPYHQTQFLGASVVSFNSSFGWGSTTGELSVTLVEDKATGNRRVYSEYGGTPSNICTRDNFNLKTSDGETKRLGSPVIFQYGGFRYAGLLANWEQNLGTSGHTYTVRIRTPGIILSNHQLILSGLDDYMPPPGPPYGKFINVMKSYQEAGFSQSYSFCNDVGLIWTDLRRILHNFWVFEYQGESYGLDLGSPALDGLPLTHNYRFSGDNIEVLSAIDNFAKAINKQIYLDIVRVSGSSVNWAIKVQTHNALEEQGGGSTINTTAGNAAARLYMNSAYQQLTGTNALKQVTGGIIDNIPHNGTNNHVVSQSYGIEVADTPSDALIVGDYMKPVVEMMDVNFVSSFPGAANSEDTRVVSSIRHYWGDNEEEAGVPRLSVGNGDEERFLADVSKEPFYRKLSEAGCTVNADGGTTGERKYYLVSVLAIRAAANNFDSWYELMSLYSPACIRAFLDLDPESEVGSFLPRAVYYILDNEGTDLSGARNEYESYVAEREAMLKDDKSGKELLRALHSFVAKFSSFYGKKFLVELPANFIYCCTGGTSADINAVLEKTDGGWCRDEGGSILGLPWNSSNLQSGDPGTRRFALELFKLDDGRLGPILYYDNVRVEDEQCEECTNYSNFNFVETDFSSLTQPFYAERSAGNLGYNNPQTFNKKKVWVKAQYDKLLNPCALKAFAAYAVLSTPAAVNLRPSQNMTGDNGFVLGLDKCVWHLLANEGKGAPLDINERKRMQENIMGELAASNLRGLGLIPKAHMPQAAAAPFKWNYASYGRATSSTKGAGYKASYDSKFTSSTGCHGKAIYEKNTTLNPWNFGGYEFMDDSGQLLAIMSTACVDILESGNITYTGTPGDLSIDRAGAALFGFGPACNSVSISIGMQGISTTLNFRTFIRNFGELARQQLEYLQMLGKNQQQFQRAFNLKMAERMVAQQDAANSEGGGGGGGGATEGPGGNRTETDGIRRVGYGRGSGFGQNAVIDIIMSKNFYGADADLDKPMTNTDMAKGGVYNYTVLEPFDVAVTEFGVAAARENRGDGREPVEPSEADNTPYQERGAMSLDCMFRPYQILDENVESPPGTPNPIKSPDGSDRLSQYQRVKYTVGVEDDIEDDEDTDDVDESEEAFGINNATLNPFLGKDEANFAKMATMTRGHDMQRVARGESWPLTNTLLLGPEARQGLHNTGPMRPVALKAPLVLCGWGFDTDGKPVPAAPDVGDAETTSDDDAENVGQVKFHDDWLSRADLWKVGPLDCRWDESRGVWAAGGGGGSDIVLFTEMKYETDDDDDDEASTSSSTGAKWRAKEYGGGKKVVCVDWLGLLGGTSKYTEIMKVGGSWKGMGVRRGDSVFIINLWPQSSTNYPVMNPWNYTTIDNYDANKTQALILEAGSGITTEVDGEDIELGHNALWEEVKDCESPIGDDDDDNDT